MGKEGASGASDTSWPSGCIGGRYIHSIYTYLRGPHPPVQPQALCLQSPAMYLQRLLEHKYESRVSVSLCSYIPTDRAVIMACSYNTLGPLTVLSVGEKSRVYSDSTRHTLLHQNIRDYGAQDVPSEAWTCCTTESWANDPPSFVGWTGMPDRDLRTFTLYLYGYTFWTMN